MQYKFVLYDGFVIDDELLRLDNINSEVFPDISAVKFENKIYEDEIFSRIELSGTMKLIGKDFDLVNDFIETPFIGSEGMIIDVHQNSVFLGRVFFDPRQGINYDRRELTFKVNFEDYYSKLLKLYNNKFNIAGFQIASRDFEYINQTFIEEISVSFNNKIVVGYLDVATVRYDIPIDGSLFTDSFSPSDPIGNWTQKQSFYTVNGNPNCSTYEFDLSGTSTFYRYWRLGHYEGTSSVPPPGSPGSGWVVKGAIRVGDTDYPFYIAQPTFSFNSANGASGSTPCLWSVPWTANGNTIPIPATSVVYNDVLKRLDDTIVYLIDELDARIQIDTSGTSSDSFYGFKNFVGETIQGSDKPFEDLCIIGLQNFIPDNSSPPPVQKSNPASRLEIKFSELMTEIKKQGFFWFLEDRSGTPYFRIYHKTQIVLLTTNPWLGDWFGRDYRSKTKNYVYEEAEYYKLINSQIGGNREFVGTVLENKLYGTGEIVEITSGEYFYDTEDVFGNGEVSYDDGSNTAFILICCWIDTGPLYKVRNSTGYLNNMEIANGELAWTNVIQNLLTEIPFVSAWGNDTIITIAANRQKKRRQLTLKLPLNGINDFISTSYIQINGENAEMESLIHDAKKNTGELKLLL